MRRYPNYFWILLILPSGTPIPAHAQVELNLGGWVAPEGGWDYVYTADEGQDVDGEFTGDPGSLDGTWTHNNGSDAWDGSGPGDEFRPDGVTPAAPGGAGITVYTGLGEGRKEASVLTIVDTGDPRPQGFPDPSNRKMFFCHSVLQETHVEPGLADSAPRDGLTLVARVRMMPDQDPAQPGHQLPDGGVDDDASQGVAPGYSLRDGGKGGLGYYANGLDRIFTFTPSGTAGYQFPPQVAEGLPPVNFLDVGDNTKFQAFWITIEDLDMNGLYTVTVYLNGSQVPKAVFTDISLGDDTDCDGISHLHLGLHSTPQKGAIEVDYFGYKVGLFEPAAECPGGFAASLDVATGKVAGTWSPGADATGFRILRNGLVLLDNLPRDATSFEDLDPPRPAATYELQSLVGGAPRPGCDFPRVTVETVVCPGSLTSTPDRVRREVALSWTGPKFLTVSTYRILRDGAPVGAVGAQDTGFTDQAVPPGEHVYELETVPAGPCAKLSSTARLFAPRSPEVCGDAWDNLGLGGDLQIVTTRDGLKTLYFTLNAAEDPEDVATLALEVTALPAAAIRADFPVEILARYDNGFRITNLLGEDPEPYVAFSLSRTGISQAADSNGVMEVVAQVPNPPDPGTESVSAALVSTREAKLALVSGKNILQLDSVNAGGAPEDGTQVLCLRIGAFSEGLEARVIPNPCPSGLSAAREPRGEVKLTWRAAEPHAYLILRDGAEIIRIPLGDVTSHLDADAEPGFHQYELETTDGSGCPVLRATGGGGAPDATGQIREWLLFGPLDWRCTANCASPVPATIRQDYLAGTTGGIAVDQKTVEPVEGTEIELAPGGQSTGVRAAPRVELNPGRPRKGTWFAYRSPGPVIDLNQAFGGDPGDNYVTYAVTYVENTTGADLPVEAHLSSDDSVELYVGETPVHLNRVARPWADPLTPGDTIPGITLPPGITRILMKVFEGGGATGFWLRFEKDLLPVVDGLRVHLSPTALLPPAAPAALTATAGDGQVTLDWPDSQEVDLRGYIVYRSASSGGPYTRVAGPLLVSAHTDTGLQNGVTYYYVVRVVNPAGESQSSPEASATPAAPPLLFRRADSDGNGTVDLTDPIYVLGHQFLGGPEPGCFDAADADDSGVYDLTDAIFSLGWQFLGGPEPPRPGPFACGPDPTEDLFKRCVNQSCR